MAMTSEPAGINWKFAPTPGKSGSSTTSLLMIVAVTCWVPDSVAFDTLEMSTMMVSSGSSQVSSTAVRVIEPLVLPGGMTIEVPDRR